MFIVIKEQVGAFQIAEQVVAVIRIADFDIPSGITQNEFTQSGGILVGTGAGTFIELPPGANGEVIIYDDTQPGGVKTDNLETALPRGYIDGLILSNSAGDPTNDIDISAGVCRDISNTYNLARTTTLMKKLDEAFSEGSGFGGLDTGSIANTTYHVFLIKRSDTGAVDALYSTSATAPSMPANYDSKRRIGSIVRTGGAIKAFVQDGDDFMWKASVEDVNATNPGTSAVTRTLTVPTGIRVNALIAIYSDGLISSDHAGGILFSDLSLLDNAPSGAGISLSHFTGAATQTVAGTQVRVWTNTSAQVRSRIQVSGTNTIIKANTFGWVDRRGKDA